MQFEDLDRLEYNRGNIHLKDRMDLLIERILWDFHQSQNAGLKSMDILDVFHSGYSVDNFLHQQIE